MAAEVLLLKGQGHWVFFPGAERANDPGRVVMEMEPKVGWGAAMEIEVIPPSLVVQSRPSSELSQQCIFGISSLNC